MRLLEPLNSLKGVGPALFTKLTNILPDNRIIDLLLYFPYNIIDRSLTKNLVDIQDGDIITIKFKTIKYKANFKPNLPFSVIGEVKTTDSLFTQNHEIIYLDFFMLKKLLYITYFL